MALAPTTRLHHDMGVRGLVLLLACAGWTPASARPGRLPSTSLNLPIPDALAADHPIVHVLDSEKDYTHVEPTFKEMRVKNFIHNAFINFAQPTPIVDNIREEEKYGNAGDQLDGINNAIVKGTEIGTQLIGKIVTVPRNIISAGSGKVTSALNNFGSYLIGI